MLCGNQGIFYENTSEAPEALERKKEPLYNPNILNDMFRQKIVVNCETDKIKNNCEPHITASIKTIGINHSVEHT